MGRMPTRLMLVLSAYSPLAVVVAIRIWSTNRAAAIGLIAGALVSIVALRAYLALLGRASGGEIQVERADLATAEILGYVTAYLFPFLQVDFTDVGGALSLAAVYVVILTIQVKANLVHVNPILFAFGYHVLSVTTPTDRRASLITEREYLPKGTTITVVWAGNHVALEVR